MSEQKPFNGGNIYTGGYIDLKPFKVNFSDIPNYRNVTLGNFVTIEFTEFQQCYFLYRHDGLGSPLQSMDGQPSLSWEDFTNEECCRVVDIFRVCGFDY